MTLLNFVQTSTKHKLHINVAAITITLRHPLPTTSSTTTTTTTTTVTTTTTTLTTAGETQRWQGKWGSRRNEPQVCFFFFFLFTKLIFYLSLELGVRPPPTHHHCTAKTGPNDAKRVVWTLGELFFFIFVFFSY